MATDVDWAWLAGLFEGEGCLTQEKEYGTWAILLNMTDQDVVERAHEVAGVGRLTGPYFRGEYKPYYRWTVGVQTDIEMVVNRMLPFLGRRRCAKVHEFLAWRAGKPHRGKLTDDVILRVRALIADGYSYREAAAACDVSRSSVYRALKPRAASVV